MKRVFLTIFSAAIAVAVLLANDLTAEADPAATVEIRQKLMKTASKSFGPLIAVLKGESTDLAAAAAAAQTIHDAIVEAAGLFPAGTAKNEVAGSRAKPEVWTDAATFKSAMDSLIKELAALVQAANSGDVNAFKAQFKPVGNACGGCHEGPPEKGGKFRFPKSP